jgi:EAL domain-containing protein (putative c-di-GMP-specific phosphodiesterase class I)
MRVAVNLSAQELVSDGLARRVENILRETNTDPCDLDLELKEHMLFREVLKDYATCRELKELGVRIVVDDYGIGACSLAHLSQSPVDAIKIDNTFVANIETSARDRAACSAAIAMAEQLAIDVIAEGVETEHQAEVLKGQGCRYLQGFLFSTPLPADEIQSYLNDSVSQRTLVDS